MSTGAFYGKPQQRPVAGGMHVTVHLVPVSQGRLVVFDVVADQARGRWLPWTVLPAGGNPWETAARLADDWLQGAVDDISLADVLSLQVPGGGWELAVVFRVELTRVPAADGVREPFVYAEGAFDAIGSFDPVDLERWVKAGPDGAQHAATPQSDPLVF